MTSFANKNFAILSPFLRQPTFTGRLPDMKNYSIVTSVILCTSQRFLEVPLKHMVLL